ncbi:hypothetical protein PDE_02116 [Penicillium oxalicum 114-2]|uniref:Uncharacterized protein n=1 Tax=Penicillium oxalicum (strain 114-2 / CGMCC 5302) TaxID=933388 RepID=S8AMP7_PENO1|nr:hypothetical protein PDE_02116 [Penicillium oxalicum 114-2]
MSNKNFIRQIESMSEFKLLQTVVKGEIKIQDAVQKIVDRTMSTLPSASGATQRSDIGLTDYNVSLAVMELAQRLEIPDRARLVEFTIHLQEQVALDPASNEPLKVQGDILWRDMPSFGYTELETWFEFGGAYKDRWVKLNAFLAQLTQAAWIDYPALGQEARYSPLDKSLRAIWSLSMALESESPPATLQDTAAMEAACQWLIYAGERLWINVLNARTYPKVAGAGPGKGYHKRGWTGFTRERWGLWEDALKEGRAACNDQRILKLMEEALNSLQKSMTQEK